MSMTTNSRMRSTLLPLLLVSGCALADSPSAASATASTEPTLAPVAQPQVSATVSTSAAAPTTAAAAPAKAVLEESCKWDAKFEALQNQQEKTRQAVADLKNLQQQVSRQLQQQQAPRPSATETAKKPADDKCAVQDPGKTTPDGKLILGETEWIYVDEASTVFDSRIDTGATTSSISATDITVFEREGKRWVKFKIPLSDKKSLDVEAPFVRYVVIRQASAATRDKRPIVRMTLQIGNLTEKAEFSLRDRSEMDYVLLLGREFIKDVAVVDVSREYVQGKPEGAQAVANKKKTGGKLEVQPGDAKAADKKKEKAAPAKKPVAKKASTVDNSADSNNATSAANSATAPKDQATAKDKQ